MIESQNTAPQLPSKKRYFWLNPFTWWVGFALIYFLVPFINQLMGYLPVVGPLWSGVFRAFGGLIGKIFGITIGIIGLFVPIGFRLFFVARLSIIPIIFASLFVIIALFFIVHWNKKHLISLKSRILINLFMLFILTFIVDIFTTGCWLSWHFLLEQNPLGGCGRQNTLRIFLRGILPWL